MKHLSPGRYIVTGGGGFVGKAILRALRDQGSEVISVSRSSYPELEEYGAESVVLDLSDAEHPNWSVFEKADGVFHVAAHVKMWGDYEPFYKVNVGGTKNVITACLKYGVQRLVYTSSPSVIADETDLRGIDESYPYPDEHLAFYPETKALAEREVLAANSEQLRTCSLRPHLIWGPGDTNLVPTILNRARRGKLIQIGAGDNMVDVCYIEDCVEAHLCAMDALATNVQASGLAYFISQGEPVSLWGWINEVLARHDLAPVTRKVSSKLATKIAFILELISKLWPGNPEPLLTRFLVSEMSTDHYFSIKNAQELLGFHPRYSIAQALDESFGGVSAAERKRSSI